MTSLIASDSLLVVDVGTISTRAMLFDVVDGRYRFIASGSAQTTANAPYLNISEGVRVALDQLQTVTGRTLIGADEQLIIPAAADGSGVDAFAATLSAGEPLKIVAIGLLEDVSLESAVRLAESTYGKVVQTISLNDRRKQDARIDAILRLRPELILVAGGTEGGASQSVMQLIEAVGLACYLLPEKQRPAVLYAGNQALNNRVESTLEGIVGVALGPNIRPTLEDEQLDAARVDIANAYCRIQSQQLLGVEELNGWAKGGLQPTATAFGRVVRYLSKANRLKKGAMGIDVGAAATSVAAAFDGDLVISVFPQFGLVSDLDEVSKNGGIEPIQSWLMFGSSPDRVKEYLLTKTMFPASIPMTEEELDIEYAIARQKMRNAVLAAGKGFPAGASGPGAGLLPWVEPILATGSVLTNTPSLGHSLLMLLDGVQPTGVTTVVLDKHHIASALGAAAVVNPLLTVQVLESNSFVNLGTVISPVGSARPGTPILQLKITYDNGQVANLEVKQGAFEVIPLKPGKMARLQMQPLHRYDVGMGAPGRGGGLKVMGGVLGIIIDARGRPLSLPPDHSRRQEMYKKWLWTLGGR